MADIELIESIDDQQWDSFVSQHESGWLTHTSDWRDVLEKSFKHIKGFRFVLVDRNDNKIIAGIPAYEVNSYLTGRRLVSIPFATFCDPLVTSNDQFKRLVNHLVAFKEERKCKMLEMRASSPSDLIGHERLTKKAFYVQHFLKLDSPAEQLFKNFHRTCTRQRINRAIKSELKLQRGETEQELKLFYALYTKARKRLSLPPLPYLFVKNLWMTFKPKNELDLFLARKDNQIIAGVILFKFNKRLSIELAASDDNLWDLSPNHFLFWESIKMACAEGFACVDFGRTSPNNTSLMDFKRRWGTDMAVMPYYYYPAKMAPELGEVEKSLMRKTVQGICMKAPVPLLPIIGSFCYRHMG